ncbi:MAG TPA: hypothetical protein VGM56_19440, partial [Byssovorax sp.]
MTPAERIAALESLLERIKRNAASPRVAGAAAVALATEPARAQAIRPASPSTKTAPNAAKPAPIAAKPAPIAAKPAPLASKPPPVAPPPAPAPRAMERVKPLDFDFEEEPTAVRMID